MPDFSILHTNDLHGKLLPELAAAIAAERTAAGECLLLDAGDAISSGNIYYRPGGEPALARMSELHYDAMAMGNREFHFLESGLKSKVRLAEFPVLCANLRARGDEIGGAVLPYAFFQAGGLTIAVFGLLVPMIRKGMLAGKFSPFWFEEPVRAAVEIVPELRQRANVVVGLTHLGLQRDRELARAVSGIDLIVGGHSHDVVSEPVLIGDTTIVQTGSWSHYLGRVDVSVSPAGRPGFCSKLIQVREK